MATIAGGVFVIFRLRGRTVWLRSFLAFGAGFLLAAGFMAMLPHAYGEMGESALLFVLLGYLIIHTFEHTLVPHFHFGEETHAHEAGLGRTSFLAATGGMVVHSIFDGITIGSGFALDPNLGWLLFLAVVLHKLPDGFTVASLALASGQSGNAAFAAVTALGVATFVGTAGVTIFTGWAAPLLALSSGVAIYIAATDLMPEVNRERGMRWSLMVFAGVVAFWLGDYFSHLIGAE